MESKNKKLDQKFFSDLSENQVVMKEKDRRGNKDQFDLAARKLKVNRPPLSDDNFSIRVVTPQEVENLKPEVLDYIMWLKDEHRLDDAAFESIIVLLAGFGEADLDTVKELLHSKGLDKERVIN